MNFKDLERKLLKIINNIGNSAQMQDVADAGKKEIVERTKKGSGVNKNEGKKVKLAALDPNYIKARKRLKKQGALSSDTSPSKSNLTRSGKMLSSVKTSAENKKAQIYIAGSENNRKAAQQEAQGRKFLKLSKGEVKKLLNIIEEDIKKDIKKNGL